MSRRKTVLITGCSPGGIGFELAKAFHARGLRVFATVRNIHDTDELVNMGIECLEMTVDDIQSVRSCFDEVKDLFVFEGKEEENKKLDYLINNAGRNEFCPVSDLSPAETRDMVTTNVFGPMIVTSAFLEFLLNAKGTVINMGSVGLSLPFPFYAAYNATKAALYVFSESLRVELAPLGIKVTYVHTGRVKSNLFRRWATLRSSSLYAPIKDVFYGRQQTMLMGGMETAKFAREFVDRVLGRRHSNELWIGKESLVVRLILALERWLPVKVSPWLISQSYRMDKIRKLHQG